MNNTALKSKDQIAKMKESGNIAKKALDLCWSLCSIGEKTKYIDQQVGKLISSNNAKSLFKNYPTYKPGQGFPGNVCISINNQILHGVPSDRVIQYGDVVKFDCGVLFDGWASDTAITVAVGRVKDEEAELIKDTEKMLLMAIEMVKPNIRWNEIAKMLQDFAVNKKYGIVTDAFGHGVGRHLHENLILANYVEPKYDFEIQEGMTFAIEPMNILNGNGKMVLSKDGWTLKSVNNSVGAHFEHTVAVTANGCEILTY